MECGDLSALSAGTRRSPTDPPDQDGRAVQKSADKSPHSIRFAWFRPGELIVTQMSSHGPSLPGIDGADDFGEAHARSAAREKQPLHEAGVKPKLRPDVKTLISILAAVFAVGTVAAGAPAEKPAPPASLLEFINTGFENASPLQWQADTNGSVQVFLLYDYERNSPNRAAGHWHFQLQGRPGADLDVVLHNFDNVWNGKPGSPVSKKSICYVSSDGKEWRVVPAELLEGNRLRVRVHLEKESLYLARLEPYRLSDLERLLNEIRGRPWVGITEIGKTVEGRPLEIVRVGDPEAPNRVLLRARSHAWEPGGNWIVQGLIRSLLGEDEIARKCRGRYCVYVLPMANKDGVAHGGTRFNVLGQDLNRNWDGPADPRLAPENHALEQWIGRMWAQGKPLHLAIDLHNDEAGRLHLSRPAIEGLERYLQRMKRFEALLRQHTWFTEGNTGAAFRNSGTIGEGLLERYGIDACVLEFNCNWIAGLKQHPSGAAWEQFGRQLREVFFEYFEAAPETPAAAQAFPKPIPPLMCAVDLDRGEAQEVELPDGSKARVRLLEVEETRDRVRRAVREARVRVEVNGSSLTLTSATYHLPVTIAGVQIDCPITRGYADTRSRQNVWALQKDARLRLWPAGSPWMQPGTFGYPARQRWFASDTQMANEPTFVNGDEIPGTRSIYYHWGLDFGGAEGLVEVVAATDGLVVSAAGKTLPEHTNSPAQARYDVIYLVDGRGWYYRYSHLMTIDVKPGQQVRLGQRLGLLGKEGGSGGWSHLHFDITSRQPSGEWGIQDAYAYAWEAYQRERAPKLIAVARPHRLAAVGEKVVLDGALSWSAAGRIDRYEWTFTDGTKASGPTVERTYAKSGTYSEILKITDRTGAVSCDFAVVQILDPAQTNRLPPTIHAACQPTAGLRAGDEVTFKVRAFRTTHGQEVWDFGDGTPPVTVRSDGNVNTHARDGYAVTRHRFARPGHYLVRVERANERGEKAVAHLQVEVLPPLRSSEKSSADTSRAESARK